MAITPDQQLVLVSQYRQPVGATILKLPGGGVDASDATMEMAATGGAIRGDGL